VVGHVALQQRRHTLATARFANWRAALFFAGAVVLFSPGVVVLFSLVWWYCFRNGFGAGGCLLMLCQVPDIANNTARLSVEPFCCIIGRKNGQNGRFSCQ